VQQNGPNGPDEKEGRRAASLRRRTISNDNKEMAVRHTRKVSGLLVGFATLPEKSRRDFLTKLNDFLMMSPSQKRRAIAEWQRLIDDGFCEPDALLPKR
jgi:hypothetical protein